MTSPDEKTSLPFSKKTLFEQAWEEYRTTINSSQIKKVKFIEKCSKFASEWHDPVTAINEAITEVETRSQDYQRQSRKVVRTYLLPFMNALTSFTGIVDSLSQFFARRRCPPGLTLDQYGRLFETIHYELASLSDHLENIAGYGDLYQTNQKMQSTLCNAYINIIRFWHRVDKECTKSGPKFGTPFSTKKLGCIVSHMREDVVKIKAYAGLPHNQESGEDRQANKAVRQEVGEERIRVEDHRRFQWECDGTRKLDIVLDWLSSESLNNQCLALQGRNLRGRSQITCQWLFSHDEFLQWQNNPPLSPILWIHGPPGSGKSTLCSSAIEFLAKSPGSDVVIFHFYDFAQHLSPEQILSILAAQLLLQYRQRLQEIPDELQKIIHAPESLLERVQKVIKALIEGYSRIYFFLDGLDEETTTKSLWDDAVLVLRFLAKLVDDSPTRVRVWCSSQRRDCISKELRGCRSLDIDGYTRSDLALYFSDEVSKLRLLWSSPSEQAPILEMLKSRAECSFIWAKFMIDALEECWSTARMEEHLKGFPETLAEYYHRFFECMEKLDRPLACKVFSLVIFARRPLRLKELTEAVSCLESEPHKELQHKVKPNFNTIRAIVQPFIEFINTDGTDDSCTEEQYTCRILHSTLRDFLVDHPNILCDNSSNLRISAEWPARACLHYLGQSRYSGLLVRREGRWLDVTEDPVDCRPLLVYAAKYWDKHLDDVTIAEIGSVESFITSPNFWTCVQVQSLWVEAQFSFFSRPNEDNGFNTYFRRVFPSWFARAQTGLGQKLWRDYRRFLQDWIYFLSCEQCGGEKTCEILPYIGQLDRIWFGALGPNNFLSRLEDKYTCFAFQTDVDSDGVQYVFDAVSETGDKVMILRIQLEARVSRSSILKCSCESWNLSKEHPPELQHKQTIQLSTSSCNWKLYTESVTDPTLQTGKAAPAAFGPDCQTLRIGTQLYRQAKNGRFIAIPTQYFLCDLRSIYFEEFARRRQFLVLTSRTKISKGDLRVTQIKADGAGDEDDDLDTSADEDSWVEEDEDFKDGDSSIETASDSEDEFERGTESENSSNESTSEGNTNCSANFGFEDDILPLWANHFGNEDTDTDTDNESYHSFDISGFGVEINAHSKDCDDISEHEKDLESSYDEVFDDHFFRHEGRHDWEGPWSERAEKQKAQATITVFDTRSCTRLFRLRQPIKCRLFASPPVFHPTKSLIVWPLGDGNILFVYYLAKTHFTRRLQPSTPHTGHVFMKIHFSECGEFLHIATLEAQGKAPELKDSEPLPPIKLALLVCTYRLSRRKTAKSPQKIHCMKLALGQTTRLHVSKMPFTLTWTSKDLYFSCSRKLLQVYRIPLFGSTEEKGKEDQQPVWKPRKPFFLPHSASNRAVYYFPPAENKSGKEQLPARMLIGSDFTALNDIEPNEAEEDYDILLVERVIDHSVGRRGEFHPPIGCYVDEDTNLGGWVDSHARANILQDRGVGHFDMPAERFNSDDDCDCECYYQATGTVHLLIIPALGTRSKALQYWYQFQNSCTSSVDYTDSFFP
ncbi:uncharacterized protein F5147DRAFT_716462 [Suillus discolor]|uniref:NACHT domain-containing protein n=1 Tax=Suillus discolor TaxID=1912936 RepID=A0A9P7JPD7_9AGAM|nr:uncharacterized protein F5147DRAFT_716462 [Suillus discolor]KAG2096525.1 hypothetical protein F5147DRAFT_716462 [Suillus discolor]